MTTKSLVPLILHVRQIAETASLRQLSDRELLQRFLTGEDHDAFATLIDRNGKLVLAACRQVLSDPDDIDDVFQATFLTLLHKATTVSWQPSLGSWLFSTAHRLALQARASALRRKQRERNVPAREGGEGPVAELSWREAVSVLHEELDRLPERYRLPLLSCYLEGKSRDETAESLGVTPGAVKWRLERGREVLRKRLVGRGITLSAGLLGVVANSSAGQVPPRLIQATVNAATAGPSARVAALSTGVSAIMWSKNKLAACLLLAFSLVMSAITYQALTPPSASARQQSKEAAKQPAVEEKEDDRVDLAGRVLDPQGKPVSGARVYVSRFTPENRTDPEVRATTDAEGRFRFPITQKEVARHESLVAVAREFGPDWVELDTIDPDKEITLRLVKDLPITGRVFDLEGRPIVAARVCVLSVWKAPDEDLTPLIKDLQKDPEDRRKAGGVWVKHQDLMSRISGRPGAPRMVKTGAEGRFRLTGLGRERLLYLQIKGDGIEHTFVRVLARSGLKGLPPHTHGATFNHVAGPSKPIRGMVREKGTGKPVVGVYVHGQPVLADRTGNSVFTKTDQQGRFTLLGLPKAKSYHLGAGQVPYIGASKQVADTPGLEPIRVDFELERALALRVRVIDRTTGKPVRAYVQYDVRRDNPNLDDYPSYPRNAFSWLGNDRDGWTTDTVLPGPGVISVQAVKGEFTRARLTGEDSDKHFLHNLLVSPLVLDRYHAVVPISPDAKDPKSLVLEIALDPGRSVRGQVLGADGKPLEGTIVAGLAAVRKDRDRPSDHLSQATFTAGGLDPKHPRTLVFFHKEKQLAGTITLRGDERKPVTVKLEPRGAVRGRLVDAEGEPIAKAKVWLAYASSVEPSLPWELVIGDPGTIRDQVKVTGVKTDEQGRFHLQGLVPGMKYDLRTGRNQTLRQDLIAVPGKEVELGNVQRK